MSVSKYTEAQIIGAVKQVEAGRKAEEVGREMGVSKHTVYAGEWGQPDPFLRRFVKVARRSRRDSQDGFLSIPEDRWRAKLSPLRVQEEVDVADRNH
ncbi:transposase [Bryobacter aggregatus]|uniref:transposase n=1 Tax=Bryobacter aggregatus TaxID=360054 RepID=UPI0004E0C549